MSVASGSEEHELDADDADDTMDETCMASSAVATTTTKKQTTRKRPARRRRCVYVDEDAEMSGDEKHHRGDEDDDEDEDEDEAGSLEDFINDDPLEEEEEEEQDDDDDVSLSSSSSSCSSSSSSEQGRKRTKNKKKNKKKHKKKDKKKRKNKHTKNKKKREEENRPTKKKLVGISLDARSEDSEHGHECALAEAGNDRGTPGNIGMDVQELEHAEWRTSASKKIVSAHWESPKNHASAQDGGDQDKDKDEEAEEEEDEKTRREQENQDKLMQSILKMQMYNDPDNCNNLSRNLRVVPHINDVQVHPDYDGYVYCFTSPAEGPTLSRMAWLQIMVLLHVINSPVSNACVVETEYLKPLFSSHGFMEKLSKRIPLNDEEVINDRQTRQEINAQPISEMPFDVPFVASHGLASSSGGAAGGGGGGGAFAGDDDDDFYASGGGGGLGAGDRCVWQVTNVADILVGMACVDYVVPSSSSSSSSASSLFSQHGGAGDDGGTNDCATGASSSSSKTKKGRAGQTRGQGIEEDDMEEDEEDDDHGRDGANNDINDEHEDEDERTAAFWVVMLKTRKCYNFVDHLHAFVTQGEKEAAQRGGASALLSGRKPNKDYDDVLAMIREVIMYQHEMSPNTTAYFRRPGMSNAVDPLQAIMDKCMPPSLEHTCSIYEAFRSMTWHVQNEGMFLAGAFIALFTKRINIDGCMVCACTGQKINRIWIFGASSRYVPCPAQGTC